LRIKAAGAVVDAVATRSDAGEAVASVGPRVTATGCDNNRLSKCGLGAANPVGWPSLPLTPGVPDIVETIKQQQQITLNIDRSLPLDSHRCGDELSKDTNANRVDNDERSSHHQNEKIFWICRLVSFFDAH
jgi:hypothetical protein